MLRASAEICVLRNMNRRVSVVQVVYSLGIGGSEILGRDIAIRLKNKGYSSSVCALEHGGPLERDLRSNGIRYHIVDKRPGRGLSAMWRLYGLFREIAPDIVHTHHLYELVHSFPGARLAGAKIVHTEHEYFSLSNPKAKLLLKGLSTFCERVTTVGENVTEFLNNEVGIPRRKLMTIPNGIDRKRFNPEIVPGKRFFPEDAQTIGIIARLEKAKDHCTLLHAFQKVLGECPNARLLIVGEGSEKVALQGECTRLGLQKEVGFIGLQRDIPQILAAIDIFVLSSIEEGLPISILEAMAMRKPVVATAVGNIPEVIKHNQTGLLVAPKDKDGMASAILKLLRDREFGFSMGANACRLIRERYDLDETFARYAALYESAMARNPKDVHR